MPELPSETIRVAVRRLVETTLRSGDLTAGRWDSVSPVEAIRAHRDLQANRPENYRAEVPISLEVEGYGLHLRIEGRIDGVFEEGDRAVIEEIKTTRRDLDEAALRQDPLHWAQAQVYAHMMQVTRGLQTVAVQLTYFDVESKTSRELRRDFADGELDRFFRDLVDRYLREERELREWIEIRNASARGLAFPFADYRQGQRQLAVQVYRTIRDRSQLLVQAPTGIGKTVAAVFPAVRALGEGLCRNLLFLTARNTGQTAALTSLAQMKEKGLRLRWLQLTARERICFSPGRACDARECSYALGYYDRVGGAIVQLAQAEKMDRPAIEAVAREHQVCPFELSLDLCRKADCIVGDYNYAFDPQVLLRRVILEDVGEFCLLVDEAHNLVDRAREMFSAELAKTKVLEWRRGLRGENRMLTRALSAINSWMLRTRLHCESDGGRLSQTDLPADLLPLLTRFARIAEAQLGRIPESHAEARESLVEAYFEISRFVRVSQAFDSHYRACLETADGELKVRLYCIDPSENLRQQLKRARSTILFSATLTPGSYYRQLLGCSDEADRLVLPSPFPRENLRVIVLDGLSTLYHRRHQTRDSLREALQVFARQKKGNYLFFFPSYEYLNLVLEGFERNGRELDLLVQQPGMPDLERGRFLDSFSEDRSRTLVGFAVMGGIFGEAIDLVGERLTGAAVVGVGLPGISYERDLIRDYFQAREGNGFDYAYGFPGINRVLQAAGRVIRSESDRGTILLIDERFTRSGYFRLLPAEWRPIKVRTAAQLESALSDFWAREPGEEVGCSTD